MEILSIKQGKLFLMIFFLGIILGGVTGYSLAPKPDNSSYLSQIAELHDNITKLQVTIADMNKEISRYNADIAEYIWQISQLELEIIELEGRLLEIEVYSISEFQYQKLQNAYFELKSEYLELKDLHNRIKNDYYKTQDELKWNSYLEFHGKADEYGLLNSSSSEFKINSSNLKIITRYRSDLYENFTVDIADSKGDYNLKNNYFILYQNNYTSRVTYTRINPDFGYRLKLEGTYKSSVKEDLLNGFLILNEPDYVIQIYTTSH
jgi:hypothetical protein